LASQHGPGAGGNRGVVVSYDAVRGFGFIRSGDFKADVFVHASAIDGGGGLRVGQRVAFEAEDAERGPRATRVEPGRRGLTHALAAGLGTAIVVAGIVIFLRLQGVSWAVAWLVAISPATAAVFAWDKHKALLYGRRVPEAVLLGLALVGGSPGAAVAMAGLRHKTRKTSFLVGFGVVVLIQAALVVLAWRG
jgi:uncharacterized membrane protein YsdA (DUF1294 family)/cold shock CspA family protein